MITPLVQNVHRRRLPVAVEDAALLIDGLAGPSDLVWPLGRWPRMRLAPGLAVGASGGHGPVRYSVISYVPGRRVWFRFTGPRGFHGGHGFELTPCDEGCLLTHRVDVDLRGPALVTWPLFFRPLHDALVEEALDRAEAWALAVEPRPPRSSWWVRVLRFVLRQIGSRGGGGATPIS